MPNGKVELKAGRRQRETGRETYSRGDTGHGQLAVFGRISAGPNARPAFEGEPFKDPASVLGLGKEIIGVISKGQEMQPAQTPQAPGKQITNNVSE